jgi:hypothetical protein
MHAVSDAMTAYIVHEHHGSVPDVTRSRARSPRASCIRIIGYGVRCWRYRTRDRACPCALLRRADVHHAKGARPSPLRRLAKTASEKATRSWQWRKRVRDSIGARPQLERLFAYEIALHLSKPWNRSGRQPRSRIGFPDSGS